MPETKISTQEFVLELKSEFLSFEVERRYEKGIDEE